MQEQIEREAIAISLKATKLTGRVLFIACRWLCQQGIKAYHKLETPHGKQPVNKLMNHNCATNTIPLDGDTKLFDRVARKWNVDYSFHKTGKGKYLLLFKSGQADAITAAFSEYSKRYMKRQQDKRPRIDKQFKEAAERVEQQRTKHKQHKREREVDWNNNR